VTQSSLISESAGRNQCTDENQIAAILGAKQFHGPADLADRNPVMAKALDGDGIAGALQREQQPVGCRARAGNRPPRTA